MRSSAPRRRMAGGSMGKAADDLESIGEVGSWDLGSSARRASGVAVSNSAGLPRPTKQPKAG
jgi:hypothetical protein